MTYVESEIRWGTGFDNVLSFAHPQVLDNARTWRRPVPGSRRTRNSAGVTDAWISKRDFLLAGTARHFKPSAWGGVGVQNFLDWGGEGNVFRFIPDSRYPSFYVGDCYLEEPFSDPAPQIEESDGWQSIDIVIRQQAFDFGLALRGLMFEYVAGTSITDPSSMLATFARASTANYLAANGVLTSAAVDALRAQHYIGSTRVTLLEKTSTNLCIQSEDFGTSWTAVGSPTRSAGAHTTSGVSLDLIGDDDAANNEHYHQNIPFTGDAVKSVSIFMRKGTSPSGSGSTIVLRDTTAGANRLNANIQWNADNSPNVGMTTGTHIRSVAMFDGVYRIEFQTTAVTAANTNNLQVGPADHTANGPTGNVFAGGVQAENLPFASSYKKTTTVTVVRSSDSLVFPFSYLPQPFTVYAKFIEQGTIQVTSARVLQIGKSDDTNPLFLIYNAGSSLYGAHHHNGSAAVGSTLAATPSFGATVELLATLNADGSVAISQSINAGTATTAATSAANTLNPTAWSDTKIWLNSIGSNDPGFVGSQIVRVAAGARTLAQMRAI